MKKQMLLNGMAIFLLAACQMPFSQEDKIATILKENPDLIITAMKADPVPFIKALKEASKIATKAKKEEKLQQKKVARSKEIENPIVFDMDQRVLWGASNAPFTMVGFVDFSDMRSQTAAMELSGLFEKYPNQFKFSLRHFPNKRNPNSRLAASYFEAVAKQNPSKALRFMEEVYNQQQKFGVKLKDGEKDFLYKIAENLNYDMKKVSVDLRDSFLQAKLQKDIQFVEDSKFVLAPKFFINGVPVNGFKFLDFEQLAIKLNQKHGLGLRAKKTEKGKEIVKKNQ